MISDRQWFTEKHGNTPTFTASVKKPKHHYGYEFPHPGPVDRLIDRIEDTWDDEKVGSLIGTISAIILFGCLIMAGIILGVDAIPVEVVR